MAREFQPINVQLQAQTANLMVVDGLGDSDFRRSVYKLWVQLTVSCGALTIVERDFHTITP